MSTHKRLASLLLLFSVIMSLSSCLRFTNYNSKTTTSFEKSIKKSVKNINDLKITFCMPTFRFSYKVSRNTTEDEIIEVFKATRDFILSEEFQNDFFKVYFSKHGKDAPKDNPYYPDAEINFDLTGNDVVDYEYDSSYFEGTYNSSAKMTITNYTKWILREKGNEFVTVDY